MGTQWKAIAAAFEKVTSDIDIYKNIWLCDKTYAHSIRTRDRGKSSCEVLERWTRYLKPGSRKG